MPDPQPRASAPPRDLLIIEPGFDSLSEERLDAMDREDLR